MIRRRACMSTGTQVSRYSRLGYFYLRLAQGSAPSKVAPIIFVAVVTRQSATISLIEKNGEWRLVVRLGDRYSEVHYFHQQIVNVDATQLFEEQPLCFNNRVTVEKKLAAPKRRSQAEMQQLVAEFIGSGMGRSEFCRSRGMGIGTLVRYLKGRSKDSAST